MSWRVSPWIYPVGDSLCFLGLIDYFLLVLGKFSAIIFSNIFFFSSSSGTCIIRMLVRLMLSQWSLRLSSILFIHFFFLYFIVNTFLFFKINLFLAALGLHCCTWAFFLVAVSRGYSSLPCVGLSLWWPLSSWGTGSRVQAQ